MTDLLFQITYAFYTGNFIWNDKPKLFTTIDSIDKLLRIELFYTFNFDFRTYFLKDDQEIKSSKFLIIN